MGPSYALLRSLHLVTAPNRKTASSDRDRSSNSLVSRSVHGTRANGHGGKVSFQLSLTASLHALYILGSRARPTNAALFYLPRSRSTNDRFLLVLGTAEETRRGVWTANGRSMCSRRNRSVQENVSTRALLCTKRGIARPTEPPEKRPRKILRGLFTQGRVPPRINVGRPTNRKRIARRFCGLLAQSSIAGCQLKHPLSRHTTGACPFTRVFQGRLGVAETLANSSPLDDLANSSRHDFSHVRQTTTTLCSRFWVVSLLGSIPRVQAAVFTRGNCIHIYVYDV